MRRDLAVGDDTGLTRKKLPLSCFLNSLLVFWVCYTVEVSVFMTSDCTIHLLLLGLIDGQRTAEVLAGKVRLSVHPAQMSDD